MTPADVIIFAPFLLFPVFGVLLYRSGSRLTDDWGLPGYAMYLLCLATGATLGMFASMVLW